MDVPTMKCPCCGEKVTKQAVGHINPHYEDQPYGKTIFVCAIPKKMAG